MAQALRNPTTANFIQKTLGAALLQGVTSAATLNNVTSIQNLPGVMIVDRIDTNNNETPAKREVIQFASTSGVTVATLVRNADGGGTDQDHAIGAIVEFGPDILWAQSVIDGLSQVVVAATGLLDTTKVADLTTAQTLASKTLTAPVMNGGTGASLTLYGGSLLSPIITTPTINGGTFASLPNFSGKPTFGAGFIEPFISLTDASIMYLDFSAGHKWMSTIVPSGARTFLATNATYGDVGLLRVLYASTASLGLGILNSAASISTVHWPGGSLPTPTATVAKSDMFGFVYLPTVPGWDAFIVGQNS